MEIEDILIKPDEKLVDPTEDIVFKAMFTANGELSQGALKSIISAFTGKKVTEANVIENEPQGGNRYEKHVRLDVNCILNENHLANVEMTMNATDFEFVRMEYYLARLHGASKLQGVEYDEFPDAYQISIIGNRNIEENAEVINYYEICNLKTKKPINGKMHIITAELKKFKCNEKDVKEMSSKERWAAYFAWIMDRTKLDKINQIIKTEEGIAMATSSLRRVVQDELIRMELISRDKYKHDLFNQFAVVRRKGKAEGIEIGIAREKAESEAKLDREKRDIALNLLQMGLDSIQISKATNLSIEEIKALKSQI